MKTTMHGRRIASFAVLAFSMCLAAALPAAAQSLLFGVTGDGASTPETLFILDKNHAGPTFYMTLGNGDDGETINFNPDDGFMYHSSGNGTVIFERINLSTRTVEGGPIPLPPGASDDEWVGLAYAGGGSFYFANLDDELWTVTTTGAAAQLGTMDHEPGALALWFGNLYTLVGQGVNDGNLRRISPANGATLQVIPINLPGFTVQGGLGLATDPGTGRLFAILRIMGQPRQLAIIDPMTGNASLVGNPGDTISDIAFIPDEDIMAPAPVPALPPAYLAGLASLLLIGGAALLARRARRGSAVA